MCISTYRAILVSNNQHDTSTTIEAVLLHFPAISLSYSVHLHIPSCHSGIVLVHYYSPY